jgi:hypothetical protein
VGNLSAESWRYELTLISDLATVNNRIRAYVLRALDADACRSEPISPSEEYQLGTRLADLGIYLQARAAHRSPDVVPRTPREQPAVVRDRPREPQMSWTNPTSAIYMP